MGINNNYFKYDITFLESMKIIEFNGDFWHMREGLFEDSDINPITKMTAKETREYDKIKIEAAKRRNFEVYIVWETDYINDKEGVMKECVKFLNS